MNWSFTLFLSKSPLLFESPTKLPFKITRMSSSSTWSYLSLLVETLVLAIRVLSNLKFKSLGSLISNNIEIDYSSGQSLPIMFIYLLDNFQLYIWIVVILTTLSCFYLTCIISKHYDCRYNDLILYWHYNERLSK